MSSSPAVLTPTSNQPQVFDKKEVKDNEVVPAQFNNSFWSLSKEEIYLKLREWAIPSELGTQALEISNDPNIIESYKKRAQYYQEIIVKMFQSDQYGVFKPIISKIFDRLEPKQTNEIIKHLFKEYTEQDKDPIHLITKLMSLFTLKKIEAYVKSAFPLFSNTLQEATTVSGIVKPQHSSRANEQQETLKKIAYFYAINTLDWIIESILYVLNLKAPKSDTYDQFSEMMMAERRYASVRDNWVLISGWLIALATYTKSPLLTAAITTTVVAIGSTIVWIYYKYIKPTPTECPPCKNLTAAAIRGELAPVYGRDKEIDEVFDVWRANMGSSRKIVVLTGESGGGKSEIVRGVALRIASGNVDEMFRNVQVFAVNVAELRAGENSFRGGALKQIKLILRGFEDKCAVFFDEIQAAFKNDKENTLGDKLLTEIDPGEGNLRFTIGATTRQQFATDIDNGKNDAFIRRAHKMDVKSMEKESTKVILQDVATREFSHLEITEDAIEASMKLTESKPQPMGSKALLSLAASKIQVPKNDELVEKLKGARQKFSLIERDYLNRNGEAALPFSKSGKGLTESYKSKKEEVNKLEKDLEESNKEIKKFEALIAKRESTKRASQITAMRIANLGSAASENDQKWFLMNFVYLGLALDETIAARRAKMQQDNIPTRVDRAAIEKIHSEIEAKEKAEKDAKAQIAQQAEEDEIQKHVRKLKIEAEAARRFEADRKEKSAQKS